jgi:hypothetical protein
MMVTASVGFKTPKVMLRAVLQTRFKFRCAPVQVGRQTLPS